MPSDPDSSGLRARIARWVGVLSAPALIALAILVAGLAGGGSYYVYRTYEFVQHDNQFCLSCHLMEDPYERFARSEHRDLGCKECHQPTLIERGRMGLTQFLEDPAELSAHAEVPNELCANCHIEGDPDRWRVVAATAGHRVHLESEDPSLQGLQCVECHASSLHEFTATDRTCAQSGCHEDTGIRLGGMSDLTIHCTSCHQFGAGLTEPGTEVARAALSPTSETCMSCHVMQTLTTMPADEAHGGACASCHNPHVQTTPEEAAGSCATAGCHADPGALTAIHRGLAAAVAADCLYCHKAHDFALDGADCVACHGPVHPGAGADGQVAEAIAAAGGLVHASSVRPAFAHTDHADVSCSSCHVSEPVHGAVTVTTVADCRACHHTEPVAADCTECHAEAGGSGATLEVTRTLLLSVGERPDRALPFEHRVHTGTPCATCHADGPDRSAAAADCASCHEPHHDAARDCASCHLPASPGAHRVETAHVGCGGSGCHQELPFDQLTRTRNVCLVCHQDLREHRPGGDCAECHAMTGPPFGMEP